MRPVRAPSQNGPRRGYRKAQLRKTIAVQEAQCRVFRDVAVEEQRTGRKLPFDAMMARLDLSTKVATGDFSDKS